MKLLKSIYILLLVSILPFAVSCSSDEKIDKEPASTELVKKAKEFLTNDIVLNTHATLNGVSKTLLPTGCPTKFNFEWDKAGKNLLTVSLTNFTVGNMPMSINFRCNVQTMQLNAWEKDTYKGSDWIKLYGTDGETFAAEDGGKSSDVKGSSVQGYYNVSTHEINFIVDYNMMNVRSECFLQTIDKSRINNFEAEFAKFEEDLKKYKEEHGLN